ncbi:MAG: FAD-dependent oxidoreductase [Candidatus Hodarchaeales archaeon]
MSKIKTDFDVIIIGAGIAGSSCAIQCAKKGLSTLLIDRGDPIGSKNLSGGVLWGNDLDYVLGENWYEEAPIERYVSRKGIGFLAKDDSMIIDLRFPSWAPKKNQPANGWVILRGRFDPWLAKKAEEAGVEVFCGINISELSFDENVKNKKKRQINGIIQEGNFFGAKAVVFADGATSRLAIDYGLKPEPKKNLSPLLKHDYMLGIKEVISLPQDVLENRFNLHNNYQGAAYELVSGVHDNGARVGGFLYTNRLSVSLGVVIQLETVKEGMHTYSLFQEFKSHPWIQCLIKDGERLEYGSHLVPHGGFQALPKLYHGGGLLIGDSAGFLLSNGMSILGMNYAIASADVAAKTLAEAKERNNFTEKGLSIYIKKLKKSYFYRDMKRFKKVDKLLANPRVFKQYPAVFTDIFKDILSEQGWKSTEKNYIKKPKLIGATFKSMKKNKVNRIRAIFDGLKIRHM